MRLSIKEIQVKEGRRSLDTCHVGELADSIREIGLLNPLTIDRDNFLIAGLHRLEAVKRLGWTEVDCTVSVLHPARHHHTSRDVLLNRNPAGVSPHLPETSKAATLRVTAY